MQQNPKQLEYIRRQQAQRLAARRRAEAIRRERIRRARRNRAILRFVLFLFIGMRLVKSLTLCALQPIIKAWWLLPL